MSEGFSILSLASVVTGTFSMLAAASSTYFARRREESALNELKENQASKVLGSDDLPTLGHYLYTEIGNIRISDLARREELDLKVEEALDTIISYVGRTSDVEPLPERSENPAYLDATSQVPEVPWLQDVEHEIREGEVWNGLARMRRELEIVLKRLSGSNFPSSRKNVGAGRLVRNLTDTQVIDPATAELLLSAISIANAGVHGEDISRDDALRALSFSSAALAILDRQDKLKN